MKLKAGRMEALTDGIFAIVMTIMIVGLSEVLHLANPVKNSDFYLLFLTLFDDFFVYAASFLILGILWFEHHGQFHFIKYIDPVLVFINIVWFIFLCLIPFSAMLLGNHPNFIVPALLFEGNIFIVFSILYVHWAYATHKGRLIEKDPDGKTVPRQRSICLCAIIITVCAIILSLRR